MAPFSTAILTLTLLVMVNVSLVHGKCRFPENLVRNDPWAGDYKDGQVVAYVYPMHIRMRQSIEGGSPDPFDKHCFERGPDEKFLITQDKKYQCLQFLMRTDGIVQMKTSKFYDRHSMEICNEDKMTINPFLLVQLTQPRINNFSCPFVGGFNMYVYFPHPNNSLVCGNQRLLMRMESECEEGGEIEIDFRDVKCVPKGLPRTHVQKAKCVSHWNQGKYTFIVLRHSEKLDKWWCMRTSDPLSDIREAYLWMQLVCDPTSVPDPEISMNYLKLKFVRLVFSSTCADEIQVCQGEQHFCDENFRQHCARTCGQCRYENQIGQCTFDEQYRGEWIDSGVEDEYRITFGPYTVRGDNKRGSLGNYNCLNLENEVYPEKRVLLEISDNGCLPRYACVEMNKVNSSVMKFRLGDRHAWPLPTQSKKEYICKADNFKIPNRAESRHIKDRPARLIVRTGVTKELPCNIPAHLQHGYSFNEDGRRCGGCLFYDPSANSTQFVIRPVNCDVDSTTPSSPNADRQDKPNETPLVYSCLATFSFHNNTHSIITKTLGRNQYLMWTFSGSKDITVMKASEAFVYGHTQNIRSKYILVKFSLLHNDKYHCKMNALYPTTVHRNLHWIDHKPNKENTASDPNTQSKYTTPGPNKENNHKEGKYTFYPDPPKKPEGFDAKKPKVKVTPHPSKSGSLQSGNGRGSSSVYQCNESIYVVLMMAALTIWRVTFSSEQGLLSTT